MATIGMRTTDEMIYAMSPNGNKISVSHTGAVWTGDYTVPLGKKVKGIIISNGTVPIKMDCINTDSTTVVVELMVPTVLGIDGISKIYYSGSDSTMITLIVE